MSTVEPGFVVAIVVNPRMHLARGTLTLFHRNPRLTPGWRPYAFGSPQNVWFGERRNNPYRTRLRGEHDLKAHCALPAWALAP